MGLDVYVGTMTRYFTHDWETIIQQVGREQGIEVEVVREPPPQDAVTDPDEIRNGILQWKRDYSAAVRDEAGIDADWSESPDQPYFTDKPGFDGHAALCLLAAYSLYPSVPRPSTVPEPWDTDPVYAAYLGRESRGLSTLFKRKLGPPAEGRLFSHITDLEFWLPGDFTGAVTVGGLTTVPLRAGSTGELLQQLQQLNARTYKADEATMAAWLHEEPDNSFDLNARRGLAIFTELAGKAVEFRLPMKLDY
jgi:hypothetical protein